MKIHKLEVYVLDFEEFGPDEYKNIIENKIDFVKVFVQGSSSDMEWADDHVLNKNTATIETWQKYVI
jgi:hypothetical protein